MRPLKKDGLLTTHNENDTRAVRFFNCREIVYKVFSYSESEFNRLNRVEVKSFWNEQLESEGVARPVLRGSLFDNAIGNMSLGIHIPGSIKPYIIYVVIYYFYEDATYSISNEVDESATITCESITAGLSIAHAMESISMANEVFEFECDSSINRTDTELVIFKGYERLYAGKFLDY